MKHSRISVEDPKSLGFDPDRLEKIVPAMQAFVDDQRLPNIVTLVARKGRVAHLHAYGVQSLETGKEVSSGTLFRLYSNTKPLAAVAMLILFERGILTPDDPVSRFVPELSDLPVVKPDGTLEKSKRDINIRDCLTNFTSLMVTDSQHSALGLPWHYHEEYRKTLETLGWIGSETSKRVSNSPRHYQNGFPPINSPECMAAIAKIPLADHPGRKYVYHAGFPILGAVLEAAAGKDMGQFFKEEIFEPLGMIDSDFYVNQEKVHRFPPCYIAKKIDGKAQLVLQESVETSEKVTGPRVNFGIGGDMGGVVSTITDYARFGQMLLNGGELEGARILGRKTVDLMLANHSGDKIISKLGAGSYFGLGVSVYHGENAKPRISSRGTYGWGGMAGTMYFADPKEHLLGLCFTQVVDAQIIPKNNYYETFQRLVYQALE
ncbi:MAG: class A beta-lactamase-related serine hydrolase [Gammaproteobacteria bacterium TMED1]|nr:MAG: class A beta-lactamase-related serine hydrolase [Gammaproteobacteria bacterium TMED1]